MPPNLCTIPAKCTTTMPTWHMLQLMMMMMIMMKMAMDEDAGDEDNDNDNKFQTMMSMKERWK